MASRCNPTTRDYSSANTKSAQGQISAQSIPEKNCVCVYINAACFKCAAPHLSGEHERECVKMSECCVQAAGNEAVCSPTSGGLSVMSAVLSVRRAFIYLFIFSLPWPANLRVSPTPLHRMSLFRPAKKFWESQVSQLIVRFYVRSHANTSDVSQSCSVMKSLEEWHCGGVSNGGGALSVHIPEKVEIIQRKYNIISKYSEEKICRRVITA